MQKRYGFLWHVVASEDAAGAICESAEVEASTATEAEKKLETWMRQRQAACDIEECACKKFGGDIIEDISFKMILAGMTQHMVKLN
jgi:hypothetical protein